MYLYNKYITIGQAKVELFEDIDSKPKNSPYLRRLIGRYIPKNFKLKILDLGCGHGELVYCLKNFGYENIIGIDISSELVELANRKGIKEVYRQDLNEFLDGSNEIFDVIFMMDVLEHMKIANIFELIKKIYNKLSADGILILHVPNGEGLFGMRVRYGDLTHETCFTPQSMRQLLRSFKFTNITIVEDLPVVHGFKSFIRFVLWKALTIFPRLLLISETGTTKHVLSQNFLTIADKKYDVSNK